ncbi:MAG: hypothetical protein CL920_09675 [Deltaproteobacteria bacterium]|nr:hypothetical protein [Deltaproteobacteria bacterium]
MPSEARQPVRASGNLPKMESGKRSAAACKGKWQLAQDVCPASEARQPVRASGNLPKMEPGKRSAAACGASGNLPKMCARQAKRGSL